ncbi:MAG: HAMP domain-containing histidine kinase [Clostridiales bacterium]|nr:HAMP domain-containing histidine kinase [Clostridiales bacterium]
MKKPVLKRKIDNKSAVRYLKTIFVVGVAAILSAALGTYTITNFFLIQSGVLGITDEGFVGLFWIIAFSVFCLAMGIGLSMWLGKLLITPVRTLITGMTKLSEGDFSTRITLGKYVDGATDLSKTFNTLATQLENTEILRSDFVNNFSHEVKTPLVSVTGLISLLKNEKLPHEKRIQYIELIEEEIQRLSSMTTNMLNLSKLEKQEIVADKTNFNLSEQIRTCVLLLEKKWTKKRTRLALDFDEHTLYANEDLMKQVWINLIDNSIKFSKDRGKVGISISENENDITVSISNTGEKIKDEDLAKIFNKFYQGDTSRHKEGHGIGLSIVARIIYLHNGKVNVESSDEKTTFTVILPKYNA